MADRVVDASVFAAAYFRESREGEAQRLITGQDVVAPTLVNYEMASIARRKATATPQQAQIILDDLRDFLQFHIQRLDVDYPQVVDLALLTGLSTYDASYLYLARQMNLPLITFDRQLATVSRNWTRR